MRRTWAAVALALAACADEGAAPVDSGTQGADVAEVADVADVTGDAGDASGDGQGGDTAPDAAADAAPDAADGSPALDTGDAPDGTPGPPEASLQAGAVRVTVDAVADTITLANGDTPLLVLPASGLSLGTVDALDPSYSYDPTPLFAPTFLHPPPPGLAWHGASELTITAADANQVELALSYPVGTARLVLSVTGDGRVRATWTPQALTAPLAYLRLQPVGDASEEYYGLGEVFDQVTHRGKVRPMQLGPALDLESGYNEAHVPVPLLISTRGWGLFVETAHQAAFAPGMPAQPDVADVIVGPGASATEGLVFHLLAADHPLDVTKLYYDITGYPRLPARWALGPWIWRDENDDQAQVISDVNLIRELDLATTGYWIDRPYATAVNTFDFEPVKFPDAQAMIDHARAAGLRVALWHTPYLDKSHAATAALYSEATAAGYYPPVIGGQLNGWGPLLDLTNPAAFAWWQDHVRAYTDMGIEGFKLDYAEDVVAGFGAARNAWEFWDGSDERTMQSRYQLFYHRVYAETLPDEGGFLLCRAGMWGDQVNGAIIWPGDLDASFARHGEKVDEKGEQYTAVGGLPASVIAGLSLGPSGFPFFGADTGGYRHAPPDKELFVRWFEQTALSTVMQVGTNTNDVPWEGNAKNGFDQETLDLYRVYARLHLRLWPYVWTHAQRLAIDGRPIQRPFGLAYPELGVHPSDTYLLGDDLLVAPVVERAQTERVVPLPPGRWLDWWTGEAYEGASVTLDAPLGTLPLLIREGALVPLLRPTIDTLNPVEDPSIESYATDRGLLWVRVAPGGSTSFALFDGTTLSQTTAGGLTLGYSGGAELAQGAVFEVLGVPAPSAVTDGGVALPPFASLTELESAASGWFHDPAGTLWVKVGAGTHTVVVAD
ncbi:MAG: hypothetical protein AMXMBFR64_54250 [Myxococcales bacterium]